MKKNLVPTAGNAVANVPTLNQRIFKIQFHLQNMGQSAIIIGQELIECKKSGIATGLLDLKKISNLRKFQPQKELAITMKDRCFYERL